MTDGFEVLVQEVMAAITTEPLSTSHSVPSSRVILTGVLGQSCSRPQSQGACGASPGSLCPMEIGSLAGKDAAEASSRLLTATASSWLSPLSSALTACGAMR